LGGVSDDGPHEKSHADQADQADAADARRGD
jgi:hypothetical protein